MDRALPPGHRRNYWLSVTGKALLLAALVVSAAWAGQWYFRPAISLADVRIETVERGPLEAAIRASGVVVPRDELTISSPVAAEVRAVSVSLGEHVTRGQVLMQLDTTASQLELSNLEERLALNRAQRRSQELALDDTIRQTRSTQALRAIDLESREARLARLEQLAANGIVSASELLEARLDVKRTRVEIEQIAAELVSLEARREAELERLDLEHSILDKQRADQARRVALSSVKATLDGIVTSLVEDAGTMVGAGEPLATIAAQESFSVEAAVSDFYAPQLRVGQRVHVRASTTELGGSLSRILPDPAGSRLLLFIELDDPSAPGFHANLRIEADVVTAEKPDVLQVQRGPALEGAGVTDVFVIEGRRAVRKPIRLGLGGAHRIEIVEGLGLGDRVIVSDMGVFDGVSEVRIR